MKDTLISLGWKVHATTGGMSHMTYGTFDVYITPIDTYWFKDGKAVPPLQTASAIKDNMEQHDNQKPKVEPKPKVEEPKPKVEEPKVDLAKVQPESAEDKIAKAKGDVKVEPVKSSK